MPLPSDFEKIARDRFADKALDNMHAEMREAFAFVAGDQWAADDLQELSAQERPALTFNYSEKMIDAVVGAEVNNRQEVSFKPRGMEDAQLNEVYTDGARWARDQCGAEFEESDAFRDMLIGGTGWTYTHMDYTMEPDGKLIIERVDPLYMDYDPAAYRPGLVDRRWNRHSQWMDESEAKQRWPTASFTEFSDRNRNTAIGVVRPGRMYSPNGESNDQDLHKNQVPVSYYETWVNEPYYRLAYKQQKVELTVAEYNKVKGDLADMPAIQSARQKKRVYYYGFFSGETFLEGDKSPCQAGFCYTPITGKRDRNRNTWYGLTRQMMDPQRWGNKWLSQILYIINSNAKGGLIAEEGAFIDPRKAEDDWASPDSIVMLNEGGIGKIQEKQVSPYPAGLDKLMQFALGSLPMVTGINLEALGLANREQAGVLENSRKQAAYGILAPYFDSMRLYRRSQGVVLLDYLRNYLSDGRWMRILGDDSKPAFQLTKTPDNVEYDVIVDQAPTAPDVKQRGWDALSEILPAMMKAGIPIPPDILDYSPLPAALATKWKAFIQQQQGQPSAEQMQQMQQEMQKLQQENQQAKMALKDKSQELQLKSQQSQAELQLEIQKLQAELELERAKAAAELELAKAKVAAEIELEGIKLQGDSVRAGAKLENDIAVKRRQTEADIELKKQEQSAEEAQVGGSDALKAISDALAEVGDSRKELLQANDKIAEALSAVAKALASPKTATMPDGRRITVNSH